VDPEEIAAATEAADIELDGASLAKGEGRPVGSSADPDAARAEHARDQRTILAGTLQNIVGLGVFVLATFGMNILIARAFGQGSGAFGQITLITQLAFVAGAATRFGMDMASVRRVAIEVGRGEPGRARAIVRLAVSIALAVSIPVAVAVALLAGPIANLINSPEPAVRAASLGLIFVAVAQVFLGGSRGLKIMRHTLYAYWVGQAVSWILLTLVLWELLGRTVAVTVFGYTLSWVIATAIALVSWRSATRGLSQLPAEPEEARALIRYGAPRAPAALFSQALFYTDLFVLSIYSKTPAQQAEMSVYAAAIRVAQSLVLFLTAVSYMFSPFVADLHERGERDRLNALFKQITRWTLGGTIPLLLLFWIAPGPVLELFGGSYGEGAEWLRILLVGQIFNVSVGAAGFVLIMAGRTGWDLVVYASSFLLDLVVAFALVPSQGARGAAIAQATTLIFSNAVRLFLVWRFVRIQPYDRSYLRLLIPAAIGAVVMVVVHGALEGPKWLLDLVGTGLLGGAAYYVAFLFFGLTPQERRGAKKLVGRFTGRASTAA
jgi:O-antigen/teichoic acid export membrane protein